MAAPRLGFSRAELTTACLVAALLAAAGLARYLHGVSHIVAFVLAGFALAGVAWIVSAATEQVGEHVGPAATGTLQATLGNIPEFFVVLFALQAGDTVVAQTALLGSILVNALLVLGMVLIAGALAAPDRVMRFQPRLPVDASTLLLAASLIIALLGVASLSHDLAGAHVRTISIVGAAAILIVYASWLVHYLRSGAEDAGAGLRGRPRVSIGAAVGLLVAAGVGSAFASDWFVRALEPTIRQLHISPEFAGLVIVAIAGNAVEHFVGVYLAYRGRSDLAISVVGGSVAQIAAFLYPLMVLVSLLTATHLTFAIRPEFVAALVGTAVLVWQITGDGAATPFEGVALIALFVVLATVVSFQH